MKDLHRTLRQAVLFQEKYGDKPNTIANTTLPDSLWENITLKGWSFKNVIFDGTKWNNVKVINGVFENCKFRDVELLNNEFENTSFNHLELRQGKWIGNLFRNGKLNGMQMNYYMNTSPWFESNRFENMIITNNQLKNEWDNRNGWWRNCSFTQCSLSKNSFYYQFFDGCSFDHCSFKDNDFKNATFQGKNTRASYCTFKQNSGVFGTDENGLMEHCIFHEKSGAGSPGKYRNIVVDGMGTGGIGIHDGKNIKVKNVKDAFIDNVENLVIENVIDPDMRASSYFFRSRNIIVKNLKAQQLNLFGVEDAVFENVEVNEINGPFSCTRCTFKNVLIKQSILLGPNEDLIMTDCKFENVRRLPGVKVDRIQSNGLEVKEDLTMPWEFP